MAQKQRTPALAADVLWSRISTSFSRECLVGCKHSRFHCGCETGQLLLFERLHGQAPSAELLNERGRFSNRQVHFNEHRFLDGPVYLRLCEKPRVVPTAFPKRL
jgi:hypothetical protein